MQDWQSLQANSPSATQVDKSALHIGAVAFIHRFGSSLNGHVHFDVCLVDRGGPLDLPIPGTRGRLVTLRSGPTPRPVCQRQRHVQHPWLTLVPTEIPARPLVLDAVNPT